jgi:hypothetical protein
MMAKKRLLERIAPLSTRNRFPGTAWAFKPA